MKRWQVITLVVLFIISQIAIIIYAYQQDQDVLLDDNYLAVFRTESGERVDSTYLYAIKEKKKKNKKAKYKYKYINTTSTPSGYDAVSWKEEITKKGTLKKKKDIYKKAEKHGAYSYVLYKDGKVYSIDEFKEMFN